MSTIPVKVKERITSGLKKFQAILSMAKSKDINESDTALIISDILAEIFGFTKYTEITSEFAIKKTFCDLAIRIDSKIQYLIEVKAIGLDLKNDHVRQAVDYGSNAGVDWVILSNGEIWKVFKIVFGKPVSYDLVYEFNLLLMTSKKQGDLDLLYYLCKENINKSALAEFHVQKQILNKQFMAQIILYEATLDSIRKTIRKITPDVKISNEAIKELIESEVLKRDVFEGDKVDEAKKRINKSLKAIAKKETPPDPGKTE